MSAHVPNRPDEELDEETRRILDERLKTLDEDMKTAVPLEQVIQEGRAKLTKPDLPRFSQPMITEDFSTSANSFGVR